MKGKAQTLSAVNEKKWGRVCKMKQLQSEEYADDDDPSIAPDQREGLSACEAWLKKPIGNKSPEETSNRRQKKKDANSVGSR